MKAERRLSIALILVLLNIITFALAEGNPFEGAKYDVEFITGGTTPTPAPVEQMFPTDTSSSGQNLAPTTNESSSPAAMKAVYRYLTGSPSSEVPLYYTATDNKINTRLSRGTLVLVHEYSNGRARVTFGGWNGWVAVSSLSEKDPGTGERVGYRYAYDDGGSVPLYRYGFEYAIAYVPSGAKVAITDMKEKGYTYVMHGAVSGWAKNSSLHSRLPEGVESQEGSEYYDRTLVGDTPGQAVQLYNDSSCGSWSKCGTLPEGTVVKVLSTQLNVRISYGGNEYYVKPVNVFRELMSSDAEMDGSVTVSVPDEDAAADVAGDAKEGHESGNGSEASGRTSRGSTGSNASQSPPRMSVEVRYLGVTFSCIQDAEGERMLPTAELEFETKAPAGKRIAYIYAPKTAKCTLWKKASKKSDVITKCKAGTVVMVYEYGREFCKVNYNGKAGYVLTSCLRFPDASMATPVTGVISYHGRATGSTTVNIRGAGNSSAHKIAEWRTGSEVFVYGHKDGWYEVEFRGIHGWVQDKYLTLTE